MIDGKRRDSRKKLNGIYTPLSVAKKEIWKRWNDKKLRKRVEASLKGDFPEMFKDSPGAVISRQVLSLNFELLRFLQMSNIIELKPVAFEYLQDKFITKSIDKYYLGRLFFYGEKGKRAGNLLSTLKVIRFNRSEGKKICDLKTIWNGNLVDFHHKLAYCLDSNISREDISDYLKRNGNVASKYYTYYFSLFICHGVLFENFLLEDSQTDFTKNVVLPSFEKVQAKFGLKPLIVPLVPFEDEEDLYWRYYPKFLKSKLQGLCVK